MINVPIYRAKKIDSDEYVISMTISEGTIKRKRDLLFMEVAENKWCQVDKSTLAIHFPDNMLDSQGNKIFASLSKYGKGGDILLYKDNYDEREVICIYKNYRIDLIVNKIKKTNYNFYGCSLHNVYNLTIIGIQQ